MSQVEVWNLFISIIGVLISLAGFIFAIVLILRTKKIADAARQSVKETQGVLAKNVMLADTTKVIGDIREVRAFISDGRYDAASVKLQEFQSRLVELRHLYEESTSPNEKSFQVIFSNLSVVNDSLEAKVSDPGFQFDIRKTNKFLSKVILTLQDWLGKGKYEMSKE